MDESIDSDILLSCDFEFFARLDEAAQAVEALAAYNASTGYNITAEPPAEPPEEPPARLSSPSSPSNNTKFKPFKVPAEMPVVQDLPQTPLSLFQLFIPESIVGTWVKYTNERESFLPIGPKGRFSRTLKWTPTTVAEVYLFLTIIIYMGIHRESRILDYWKTSSIVGTRPQHPIIRYMTYDRFCILYRRITLYDVENNPRTTIPTPFHQVNAWSDEVQRASNLLLCPGTCVAVDECMIGFTGRSLQKVTIPTKPTPTGFKIWVIAQRGYFLYWLWHIPGQNYDISGNMSPRTTRKRKRDSDDEDLRYLTPTQSVVVALVNKLPAKTYHVFMDNLFTSPPLFATLRQQGIAATGTCRAKAGIFEPFIQAKKDDIRHIKLWQHNEIRSQPAESGQVRGPINKLPNKSLTNLFFLPLGQPNCLER